MKFLKFCKIGSVLCLLILGLVACEKEGPMEKAGEKADEAIQQTQQNIDEAKEDVKENAKDAKDAVNY